MDNECSGGTVKCKDCRKPFHLKTESEYILSYCDGCEKLIVLYTTNPAILAKDSGKPPVFISSGPGGKCRKCGNMLTIRNNKDYVSLRCIECGFSIIYKMSTHRGVARFIGGKDFSKDHYWLSGKRLADRKKRDEEVKK